MMLQPASPDETRRAAVARLTPKERECLERWLTHATAKEIALDLGVSHHAVEKRLKSARGKLGVASTLDAARLLAAADAYGRTASDPPEVADTLNSDKAIDPGSASPDKKRRRRSVLLAGVALMSLILLAAALLAPISAGPELTIKSEVFVVRDAGIAAERDKANTQNFAVLDSNRSGFLEQAELDKTRFTVRHVPAGATRATEEQIVSPQAWDSDRDGRVSLAEYLAAKALRSTRR